MRGQRHAWLLVFLFATAATAGQAEDEVGDDVKRGYESLPEEGHVLLGAAREIEAYATLTKAQRATYEAIVHALDNTDLLEIVHAVTAVWGEAVDADGRPSRQGMDQFRISVVLNRDARDKLWEHGTKLETRGHVKLPNGNRVGERDSDSARELGDPPNLHVSWLEEDPRIGEIDIDYRPLASNPFTGGHSEPENSDVRKSYDGTPHYCSYLAKYSGELVDWWTDDDDNGEDCGP